MSDATPSLKGDGKASRKFLQTVISTGIVWATGSGGWFMDKMDADQWIYMSLSCLGIGLSIYGLANVVEKFALAKVAKK